MDAPVNPDRETDDLTLRQRLIERITACWSTQALGIAAELKLPDLLQDGPADARSLAARCGCDCDALRRLLRALCTLEVCTQLEDGRFELAPAGALLCQSNLDYSNGLRAMALWWRGPMWATWGDLAYSVRTGASARGLHTGRSHYGFMDGSTALADLFHETMRAVTQLVSHDVACLPCWSEIQTLVDVGGGHGELAAAVAEAQPHVQFTVMDRPDAEHGARRLLQARGLWPRAHFSAGDFLEAVPSGADCYLLKSILHNWGDADCQRILASCARAARPGARLLVVERTWREPPGARPRDQAIARTDLNMLIGLGGRERSLAEFSALLQGAGFEVSQVSPTRHEFDLIEARRA